MSALVKLADVSKRYADATALHATNLSVERGKTTILIGPSGCGKSTLLRLIIRLIEPDSGAIEFNGEPITADTIGTLRRRRVPIVSAVIGSPLNSIEPESGSIKRMINRSKVDLPQPLGPMRMVVLPRSTERLVACNAVASA